MMIIAAYEQGRPSQFHGVLTGDQRKAGSLFDLALLSQMQREKVIFIRENGDARRQVGHTSAT